jgi:protein gp37
VFDNEVPGAWRQSLMTLVADTPHLDWMLLTKRIGNARKMLVEASMHDGRLLTANDEYAPPPNLWIGATIVNQEEADRDIDKLLATPATVRFLSMEPLLGPVTLNPWLMAEHGRRHIGARPGIGWVIVGGESGPGARPMHPAWVRRLRDQCAAAAVPFLFKQHGEWLATEFCDDDMAMLPSKRTVWVRPDGSFHALVDGPVDFFGGDEETAWVGKKAAGRLLDGSLHDGYPASYGAADGR